MKIFIMLILLILMCGCTVNHKTTKNSSPRPQAAINTSATQNSPALNTTSPSMPVDDAVDSIALKTDIDQDSLDASISQSETGGNNTVTVSAEGISAQQAINEALRMAVEQVAGIKIFSQTEVQDFVAVKDAVITESFGLVTSYKVLTQREISKGLYAVKVQATITQDVASRWMEMQSILRQKGRPTIMFCIKETLDGVETPQSTGELRLMSKFHELGFEVIDRRNFEQTRDLQKYIKSLEGDNDAIIAAASDQGADLVVVGLLEGLYKGETTLYDMPYIQHNYIYGTKIIRTDTSQVVASLDNTFNKSYAMMKLSREAAGRAGFGNVVEYGFVQPMVVDLVKTWIKEIQDTGTPISIVISGIKRRTGKQIMQILEETSGIMGVKKESFRRNRYKIKVYTNLSTDDLSDVLENMPDYPMEVEEESKNTIEVIYNPEE